MSLIKEKDEEEFLKWAKAATHGLDESAVMCGIYGEDKEGKTRYEFALQIGHCLLEGKPLFLAVPFGVTLPEKLEKICTKVIRYDPSNMETIKFGLTQALTEEGINKQ